MRLLRLIRLFRRQEGISLVVAVGVLGVLSLSGTTLVYYSGANERTSHYSKGNGTAYDLAEAGLNEMMSVLSKTSNNPLDKYLLPETTHSLDGGTVTWYGVLDTNRYVWNLTSIGKVKNATGPSTRDVTRKLTAEVPVTPKTTQTLDNQSWNYIMSTQVTGGECDMTLRNTVEVGSRLYVKGNLCLENSSWISGGANVSVLSEGYVKMFSSQNRIGSQAEEVAELHVDDGCKYFHNPLHDPCVEGDGRDSRYDNVWAGSISSTPQTLTPPATDWDTWYLNASPGPYYPCTAATLNAPTFDSPVAASTATKDVKLSYRNTSVPLQDLTPPASYSCKTATGELTWDAAKKLLTVRGAIYIDGSVKVENGAVNQYNGQATIYLSGSLLIKNSKLCGGAQGSNCDFNAWNPNTEMLVFVSNGSGGQTDVAVGDSIQLTSAQFQGALYATNKLQLDTSSRSDGPMVASEVVLGQSIVTDDFPIITTVPPGMPGNPAVYAQPNPPQLYSG